MKVSIDVRGGRRSWDPEAIERLSLFALSYMGVPKACELSVSLVSNDEIAELNRTWRGIDAPTDVLSFQCDDPFGGDLEGLDSGQGSEGRIEADEANEAPMQIGDVVIACDVVEEQCKGFGTTFEEEASLMLVHSILHLLGYDHIEQEQAERMQKLEKEILDSYGLKGIR